MFLTERQRAILRQAARNQQVVVVFEHLGRRELLGEATWDLSAAALPSDAEVRALVRMGHLFPGPASGATTFSATATGRAAALQR